MKLTLITELNCEVKTCITELNYEVKRLVLLN
jgi:hypothetical protein